MTQEQIQWAEVYACALRVGLGLYFANCFAKFGGYFEEKIVLRNMRNIVLIERNLFRSGHPKKNHAKCGFNAQNFLTGGWSRATDRSSSTPQPPI